MLIEFIIGSRPQISELLKYERHAFRLQHRVPISHLHMQVRAGRVAAVSKHGQRITRMHPIMHPCLDASILQVRVGHVAVGSDLQDHVIASDVVERDRREHAGHVVRDSINNFGDLALGDGEDRLAPAPPVVIARGAVVTRIAIRAHLDPVNREPLR